MGVHKKADDWMPGFVRHLGEHGSIGAACKAAGVSAAILGSRRRDNPAFDAECREALARGRAGAGRRPARPRAERNALVLQYLFLVRQVAAHLRHLDAVSRRYEDCLSVGYLSLVRFADTWTEGRYCFQVCARRRIRWDIIDYVKAWRELRHETPLTDYAHRQGRAFDVAAPAAGPAAEVNEALASADPGTRQLLTLLYGLEGEAHTQKDVAGRLGVNEKTIRRRHDKALDQMRAALA